MTTYVIKSGQSYFKNRRENGGCYWDEDIERAFQFETKLKADDEVKRLSSVSSQSEFTVLPYEPIYPQGPSGRDMITVWYVVSCLLEHKGLLKDLEKARKVNQRKPYDPKGMDESGKFYFEGLPAEISIRIISKIRWDDITRILERNPGLDTNLTTLQKLSEFLETPNSDE